MTNEDIKKIFASHFKETELNIERFGVGIGNYVFHVINTTNNDEYVIRCSENSYDNTNYLLTKLAELNILTTKILYSGIYNGINYMICNYIKGKDIGLVYNTLNSNDKKIIAKEVMEIQKRVANIKFEELKVVPEAGGKDLVIDILNRAKKLIVKNGFFDAKKVDSLLEILPIFDDYFQKLIPVCYLDDISTKNLLVYNKHVSGVIDIDWISYGDPLTFIALTNMALLDMEYDTDYADYLLLEVGITNTSAQYKVFLFYTLMYCVDFMGERGTIFNGKMIDINDTVITKLNLIYDKLLQKLKKEINKINHLGTVLIETDRLILRKCQEVDYKESFLYCCSDPELARLQNFEVHKNDQTTRRSFIEKEEQYKQDNSFYEWAIINKETNTFMGEIALVNYDEETNSFETGYHLGKVFRGHGYMQEAISAICEFVFDKLHCNSLYALILNDNLGSQKCVLANNFAYTKTISDYKDDVYEGPIDKYEITREKYYSLKNTKKK